MTQRKASNRFSMVALSVAGVAAAVIACAGTDAPDAPSDSYDGIGSMATGGTGGMGAGGSGMGGGSMAGAAGSGMAGGGAICDAPATVLAAKCGTPGCHVAGAAISGLTASAADYDALRGKASVSGACMEQIIDEADPENSLILTKVEGTQGSTCGANMPLGPALSATEVDCIRSWLVGTYGEAPAAPAGGGAAPGGGGAVGGGGGAAACDGEAVLVRSCGAAGCHGTGSGFGAFAVTGVTVGSLADNSANNPACGSYLDPANPDQSAIIRRVKQPAECGAPMPLGAPPLSDADVQCIREWMTSLAP